MLHTQVQEAALLALAALARDNPSVAVKLTRPSQDQSCWSDRYYRLAKSDVCLQLFYPLYSRYASLDLLIHRLRPVSGMRAVCRSLHIDIEA
jgi:hypothetical protein